MSLESEKEREVRLKSEFEKEDAAFLEDTIWVPTGFFELVDDFVYTILLKQPAGGELSLAKFGKNYFSDLLALIISNGVDVDPPSEGDADSNLMQDDNLNENRVSDGFGEPPMFNVVQVNRPDGLQDVIRYLVRRVLHHQPPGTKLDLMLFAKEHFDKILLKYGITDDDESQSEFSQDQTSDDYRLSNVNENANESKRLGSQEGEEVNKNRRCGISSEHIDPNNKAEVKRIPKDAATTEKIKKSAKNVLMLKNLEDKELQTVIEVLKPEKVKAGVWVIREGDDGDNFFIVNSGTFNIYKKEDKKDKGNGKLISTLKGEGSFGELALLYSWPRQASVEAVTDGSLWVLERSAFHIISSGAAFQQRLKLQEIIGQIEILKKLSPEEIMTLCDTIQVKHFQDGEVILKQNEDGDSMFFLMEGEAVVTQTSAQGTTKQLQKLSPGNYFGEMALITMETRQASVTATGKVTCGELSVDAFERLLGPCKEIMRRNQHNYSVQAAEAFKK